MLTTMLQIEERAGTRRSSPAIRALLRRMEEEYDEMPGLSVTARQAQRLWQVERQACAAALSTLVERGFLKRTRGGLYVRARA